MSTNSRDPYRSLAIAVLHMAVRDSLDYERQKAIWLKAKKQLRGAARRVKANQRIKDKKRYLKTPIRKYLKALYHYALVRDAWQWVNGKQSKAWADLCDIEKWPPSRDRLAKARAEAIENQDVSVMRFFGDA